MGIVFRALDRDVVDGKRYGPVHVALKIINQEKQGGPEAIEALKHEGISTSKLRRQENIVEIYSIERDGDTWFLTMELLEGESFDSVIGRYPNGVPQVEVLPLVSQLCDGMSYAHKHQIIHSDLKPSNVFVTRDRVVKILDFGIASRVRAIGDPQTRFDPASLGRTFPIIRFPGNVVGCERRQTG